MIEASPALTGAGALTAALAAALVLTPLAILLAGRLELYDRPGGWKAHPAPTPYLGGAAVLAGAALGVALFGEGQWPVAIVLATLALAVLGTVDDAVQLHAWPRLLVEIGAGAAAWEAGVGWDVFGVEALDLGLTIAWVVAVVNAFNLLDLMDGVATSAVGASAATVAVLAGFQGNYGLMACCLALLGACLGFLRHNLADPARIFLGDGGTMPIGFLLAVASAAVLRGEPAGAALPAAVLIVAVPLFDAGYRALLRIRAGVSLMTAGPDSITNRLRDRLGSERLVSASVAAAQTLGGAAAIAAVEWSPVSAVLAVALLAALALGAARRYLMPLPAPQPSLKAK